MDESHPLFNLCKKSGENSSENPANIFEAQEYPYALMVKFLEKSSYSHRHRLLVLALKCAVEQYTEAQLWGDFRGVVTAAEVEVDLTPGKEVFYNVEKTENLGERCAAAFEKSAPMMVVALGDLMKLKNATGNPVYDVQTAEQMSLFGRVTRLYEMRKDRYSAPVAGRYLARYLEEMDGAWRYSITDLRAQEKRPLAIDVNMRPWEAPVVLGLGVMKLASNQLGGVWYPMTRLSAHYQQTLQAFCQARKVEVDAELLPPLKY